MKKLVNKSTVTQKLLITRRIDGKLVKAQIFLKPGGFYEFQTPPDLLGSIYMDYYKALSAIGIQLEITNEQPIEEPQHTNSKEVDPFEPVEFVTANESEAPKNEYVTPEIVEVKGIPDPDNKSNEADISSLIGYLDSTYNKSKLIEIATDLKLETWGTKAELSERIATSNPTYVLELMQ